MCYASSSEGAYVVRFGLYLFVNSFLVPSFHRSLISLYYFFIAATILPLVRH